MPVWLWYCIKGRSLWFFTPSNPSLTFGGFEGESKQEMYRQLPDGAYPKSIFIDKTYKWQRVEDELGKEKFTFPLVVKPDVGMMGFMFRILNNAVDLHTYHHLIDCTYIIQELVTYPIEVSVFYYRYPNQKKGTITGFIKKETLQVTGDGTSTLKCLIRQSPRARFRVAEIEAKNQHNLKSIVSQGEIYFLSQAYNLSRGGRLISMAHEINDELLEVFDGLSLHAKHFYYGRYDIKCASIENLKKGKNFSILEFNGCGAEPHHAYGNGNTLLGAYKIFLHHWKVLYQISQHNKDSGTRPWKFSVGKRFLQEAKKHFRRLKALDLVTKTD
ncbi:MAG: hypothetical protein ABIO05_01925 [Ferruginibacter sp.]